MAFATNRASELAQYDATEPVFVPSATTDAFLSFLKADVPKGKAHHQTLERVKTDSPTLLVFYKWGWATHYEF
jgi:hypothetical protein